MIIISLYDRHSVSLCYHMLHITILIIFEHKVRMSIFIGWMSLLATNVSALFLTNSNNFFLTCIRFFILMQITSQKPNHPANSFYYPRLTELPPLATIWVKRQGRSPVRQQNRVSNHILPEATKPHRFSGRSSNTFDTSQGRVFCLLIVIFFLFAF